MALFGLFGKEKSGPSSNEFDEKGNKIQPNTQVNPEGGVDFMNNATVGAATAENAPIDPTAALEVDPGADTSQAVQAEQSAVEVVANPVSTPATPVGGVDEAAVAGNVDQQLANAGFEPSGQVVVQPEVAPTAETEQAPVEPVGLETQQAANTTPEQPAQLGSETPKAA